VHAERREDQPIVVIASERMDPDLGWREVGVGELIHVGPSAEVDRETLLSGPPRHPMVLSGRDAESQAYERDD
jgi:glutamine amidotransferase